MMTSQRYAEINLPDVLGWEWTSPDWTNDEGELVKGTRAQLLFDRHNHSFTYCPQSVTGAWLSIRCEGSMWEGVSTLKAARAVAKAFIQGEES